MRLRTSAPESSLYAERVGAKWSRPPRSTSFNHRRAGVRGVDGPVRGDVTGTIEPLDRGTRSRVTLNLELKGHGIGKLLLQLVVHRQAKKEMPQIAQNLKKLLESGGSHTG